MELPVQRLAARVLPQDGEPDDALVAQWLREWIAQAAVRKLARDSSPAREAA